MNITPNVVHRQTIIVLLQYIFNLMGRAITNNSAGLALNEFKQVTIEIFG